MSELKATSEDVRFAYRLLLGREPDDAGLAHNLQRLSAHALTTRQVAEVFMDSSEFLHLQMSFADLAEPDLLRGPRSWLSSHACVQREIEGRTFRYWATRLRDRPGKLHRKLWEWCYIVQALYERGILKPDARGLGFAVGTEPLTSLFASLGCEIVATDLDSAFANEAGWVATNQNASGLADLNVRGICPTPILASKVAFRPVDMRSIPDDMRGFDFLWSSCAMEHLGSLKNGLDFVERSLQCLRPGGYAVHTTELNCDSDELTFESTTDVVYRRADLTRLAHDLLADGHEVAPLDFDSGDGPADLRVDEPPYQGRNCLKLRIGGFASTSFGLIIRKSTTRKEGSRHEA